MGKGITCIPFLEVDFAGSVPFCFSETFEGMWPDGSSWGAQDEKGVGTATSLKSD